MEKRIGVIGIVVEDINKSKEINEIYIIMQISLLKNGSLIGTELCYITYSRWYY